jgi:hypothetical protein
MTLFQKMNAAEYKKLLEFKTKYPATGERLINSLSQTHLVLHLTLIDCLDLASALGIESHTFSGAILDAFQSKP